MRQYLLILYDRWKVSGSLVDKSNFKTFKKQYNKAIADAKRAANDEVIKSAKNKCKMAWKVIKNEAEPNKIRQPVPLSPDRLNSHFVNVSADLNTADNSTSPDY